MRPARYIVVTFAILAVLVPAGYAYMHWSKSGPGAGLYSHDWQPEAVFKYWHPERFYRPVNSVAGTFTGAQCIECHSGVTPGVVNDWRASRHSHPGGGQAPVYCTACHGNDHMNLHLPTPQVCGGCHAQRHAQFVDEKRYGFPSHALAMDRAEDAKHFADKPKAEVSACLQCHSVASKCDSCHTRHRFSAAEARRAESCITCHSGPPHPDDETFFASAHGRRYLAEGAKWDWSKPLRKGNYPVPTCAYCHMRNGNHQVADKTIWKFGLLEVNPLTSGNEIRRKAWVEVCSDCHDAAWSAQQLRGLDQERKRAWSMLDTAEDELKDLRSDKLFYPVAGQRPLYPMDSMERLWPRERIGYYDGQASAFYNVSPIERDYFEMWYFASLGAYKGAAHGAPGFVAEGHARMNKALSTIRREAQALRTQSDTEHKTHRNAPDPRPLWLDGEYTTFNREHN
jgi:hydroxylamine dehydrogenase